jgi:hypothetical protein
MQFGLDVVVLRTTHQACSSGHQPTLGFATTVVLYGPDIPHYFHPKWSDGLKANEN